MKATAKTHIVDRTPSGRVLSVMEGQQIDVADDDTEMVALVGGYVRSGDMEVQGVRAESKAVKAADAADAAQAEADQQAAEAAAAPTAAEPAAEATEPDTAEEAPPAGSTRATKATGRKAAG